MKKILGLLFVAMIGFAMMASGASAVSTLDIAAADVVAADTDVDAQPTGPYVVGSEWLAGQAGVVTVDLGNALPAPGGVAADRSDILYTAGIDLGVNSTMVVTVTNGAIGPNTAYGLWNRTNPNPGLAADMVDFTADANGNYTSMTFKIVAAVVVGDVLVFTEDSNAPVAATRPVLKFTAAQLAAGNMTIQVTKAYDDTSLPLAAPLTAAEVLAKKAAQLSAKVQYLTVGGYVDGNATSVIDVGAANPRAMFVVEGAGNDTPNNTTSQAAILVVAAAVNDGIIVANAAYTITLTGDQNAIFNVDLEGTAFTHGVGQWTIASTFAAHDLTAAGDNDIIITVDGTSVINTVRYYTVTLVIDPSEAGVANQTSLSSANAFEWTINGWQGTVPYQWASATPTEDTFIKIFNNSTIDADVFVDVTPDAGPTVAGVSLATIPAGTVGIFWAKDIADAAGIDLGAFAAVYTVIAPVNDITAMANQKRPGGVDRVVPVYTGAADYKNY